MHRNEADDDRPETAESAMRHDDRERELEHRLDRLAPARRAVWPKDDRRSSERLAQPRGSHPARRSDDLGDGGRSAPDQPFG